jgi:hypothetical protein
MVVNDFKTCLRKQSGPKITYRRLIYEVILRKTTKYFTQDNRYYGQGRAQHLPSYSHQCQRLNQVARFTAM